MIAYTELSCLSLSTKDISLLLGIGTNSAYLLMRNPSFPSYRIGKKLYVARKDFLCWYEKMAGKKNFVL